MERNLFVAILAALLCFAAVYTGSLLVSASVRRRAVAMAAQGDSHTLSGLLSWRFRNGFSSLAPLADVLMKRGRIARFAQGAASMAAQRGLSATPSSTLTVIMAGLCAMAVCTAVFTGSFVGALACPVCLTCIIAAAVANAEDKREEEIRNAVPEALESMADCFGSGFTLLQTFQQVAKDAPGQLGETFSNSAHVLEVGGSAEEALADLREGAHASELAFVAVALDVQHQSGGAMRQVLEAATDTVKGELALRRSLRVQTAQAKLSARVVVIMPFILVAAFSLASPDFLSPFFTSAAGYALLGLAIVMQVAGILLVRRALSVEGVS